jgi:transposase
MVEQGYTYFKIRDILQVSVGFISKWRQAFEAEGIEGISLKYKGSKSYLDENQRQAVNSWLSEKQSWNLSELMQELEDSYNVVFASKQSYYDLFRDAGISWKKTQKYNPQKDPELVEKKTRNYNLVGKS